MQEFTSGMNSTRAKIYNVLQITSNNNTCLLSESSIHYLRENPICNMYLIFSLIAKYD